MAGQEIISREGEDDVWSVPLPLIVNEGSNKLMLQLQFDSAQTQFLSSLPVLHEAARQGNLLHAEVLHLPTCGGNSDGGSTAKSLSRGVDRIK